MSAVAQDTKATSRGESDEALAAELGPVGLRWHANGQVALSGALHRLAVACDEAFVRLADRWSAEPEQHPAMIDASALQSVEYLTSFPHQATFPTALDADEANLRKFTEQSPLDDGGVVRLTNVAPVRQVLTPAACYHVYLHHQREAFDVARYFTTVNTCFRRESRYEPLRRQWSFRMREIICVGTRAEVIAFLARTREGVTVLLNELDLPASWDTATDPFFQPAQNPRYLSQRLRPTKHEARFGGELAIASVNLHEDHFGVAFGITREDRAAVSGCVAFGLERWLYAIISKHGSNPDGWPDLEAAARRAAASTSVGSDGNDDSGTEGAEPVAPTS